MGRELAPAVQERARAAEPVAVPRVPDADGDDVGEMTMDDEVGEMTLDDEELEF